MRIVLVHIVIFFSFSCFNNLNAQNFVTDLKQMYNAYNNVKNLHAEAEIRIFSSHESDKYSVVKKIRIKKDGENYYYQIGQYEIILTTEDHLMINNSAKTMYYSKRDKGINASALEQAMPELDSVLNRADTVVFVGYDQNTLHYTITASKMLIQTTELFIDKKTKLIKKLVYYYDKEKYESNNKAEVYFSLLNTSPEFNTKTFSPDKYITKSAGKIQQTGSYASYYLKINEHKK